MVQRLTFAPGTRMLEAEIIEWGVRGSFVTLENRIGGHTTCISIEYGGRVIIIDSGTAMIDVAAYLRAKYLRLPTSTLVVYVIQTHLHQDHIAGFSAFNLVFDPRVTIHLVGSRHEGFPGESWTAIDVLEKMVFRPPFFPMPFRALPCKFEFEELNPVGDHFTIPCPVGGNIEVDMRPMFHPNQSFGFRLNIGGKILAVTMDHEAHPDLDRHIFYLWEGATVVITEVQYPELVYLQKVGWGHICDTVAGRHALAARLAKDALLLWTHHDIDANFNDLFEMGKRMTDICQIRTEPAIQGNRFLF